MDSELLGFGGITILVCLPLTENVHHIDFNLKVSSQIGNFHGILDYHTILESLSSGLLKSYAKCFRNFKKSL